MSIGEAKPYWKQRLSNTFGYYKGTYLPGHITIGCFEKWNDYHYEQVRLENFPHPALKGKICTAIFYPTTIMESHINCCEEVRTKYLETKNEHYFDILIHLLPNSYKVVEL